MLKFFRLWRTMLTNDEELEQVLHIEGKIIILCCLSSSLFPSSFDHSHKSNRSATFSDVDWQIDPDFFQIFVYQTVLKNTISPSLVLTYKMTFLFFNGSLKGQTNYSPWHFACLLFVTLNHLTTLQIFLSIISSSAGNRIDKLSSWPCLIDVVLACYFCCIVC